MTEPKDHLAFRFPGDFYHSYRGDAPNDLGFGKDIRIIKYILCVLDEFNIKGSPASSTWDYKNHSSLEKDMPEHCPKRVQSTQKQVVAVMEELEFMPYNTDGLDRKFANQVDSKK